VTKEFQSTDHWFWTLFEKKRKKPVNNNSGFGMRTRKLTEKIFQWVDLHYSSRHTHLMSSLASSPLKKRKKHAWLPDICNLFSVNLSAQVRKAIQPESAADLVKSQFLSEIISDPEEFVAIKSQKDHLSRTRTK